MRLPAVFGRPDAAALSACLAHEQARIVVCPQATRGMGASLACGVGAAHQAMGWLVALGDMPHVPPAIVARLADRLRDGAAIVAPEFQGRRGHPVGFSREFFGALCSLDGDRGAREIIETHAGRLERIASAHRGVLWDVDTAADLQAGAGNQL